MEELKVVIKELPIDLLDENTGQIPDVPANPRRITDEAFELLKKSIEESPEMKNLDEELCSYCAATEYGEHREYHTPDGVYMCEGRHCSEAYDEFIEENYQVVHAPRSFYKVKVSE